MPLVTVGKTSISKPSKERLVDYGSIFSLPSIYVKFTSISILLPERGAFRFILYIPFGVETTCNLGLLAFERVGCISSFDRDSDVLLNQRLE